MIMFNFLIFIRTGITNNCPLSQDQHLCYSCQHQQQMFKILHKQTVMLACPHPLVIIPKKMIVSLITLNLYPTLMIHPHLYQISVALQLLKLLYPLLHHLLLHYSLQVLEANQEEEEVRPRPLVALNLQYKGPLLDV